MGRNFAEELAFAPEMGMETAIRLHLTGNHYPPVPVSMVSVCIEAIDAYWEEDLNREVELPEGISWRGQNSAPAYAIIESHHLEAWCMEIEK
jgi:preprotein translocase subunit SecA